MSKRLTADQHLRNALVDLAKARDAEHDSGYAEDLQLLVDDVIRELRSRRALAIGREQE